MLIPGYKTWRQDIISDFYRVLQLLMLAMSWGFLFLSPGSIFTDLINPSRTKLCSFFAIKTSTCDYISAGSLLITIADNQKYTRTPPPRRWFTMIWSRSWCEKWDPVNISYIGKTFTASVKWGGATTITNNNHSRIQGGTSSSDSPNKMFNINCLQLGVRRVTSCQQ